MESIPLKTAIQNHSRFHARFPDVAKRMQIEGKASPRNTRPDKAALLRKGEQSLSAAPINRKIAFNRAPGRINKTERIIQTKGKEYVSRIIY